MAEEKKMMRREWEMQEATRRRTAELKEKMRAAKAAPGAPENKAAPGAPANKAAVEEDEYEDEYPKHVGGGYYELSNGVRVKGKSAAKRRQSKLA